MSHQHKTLLLQYCIAVNNIFSFCTFWEMFAKAFKRNAHAPMNPTLFFFLLSLTEKRKYICDSDFSQNVPQKIVRFLDVTSRKSHFNESLRPVNFAKKS